MRSVIFFIPIIILLGSCLERLSQKDIDEIDKSLTSESVFNSEYLDSLYARYPKSDYIIGMKVLSLLSSDKLDQARILLDGVKEKGTYSFTAEAVMYDHIQDSVMAEVSFRKAHELDVKQSNKWLRLYMYYHFKKKDREYALKQLERSIEIDGSFFRAIIEKSYLLSPAENCEQVISLLSKVDTTFGDADWLSFLGDAYFYCRDMEKARRSYSLSERVKENGYAFLGLGNINCYFLNDLKTAEAYYRKSLEYEDTYCDGRISLGWLAFEMENLIAAENEFVAALDSCYTQGVFVETVMFFLKTNNHQKAKKFIERWKGDFGRSYLVEGLSLVEKISTENFTVDERNKLIDDYYHEFGEVAAGWLSETFIELSGGRENVKFF